MRLRWFHKSSIIFSGSAALALGGGVGTVLLSQYFRENRSAVQAESSITSRLPNGNGNAGPIQDDQMTLKYVQVFFRHGARTPLTHLYGVEEEIYDPRFLQSKVVHAEIPYIVRGLNGDTERPPSTLQCKYKLTTFKGGLHAGMLTSQGKDQAYMLGKRLRDRYVSFIGAKFDPQYVYSQSTNIDRCIESLSCVLAGLFDKSSFSEEDPVRIRVNPLSEEKMIPSTSTCPALDSLSNASRDAINRNADFIELVNKIKAVTGDPTKIEDFDMMQVRDHIIARKTHGLPVPQFLLDLEDEINKSAVTVLISHVCGDCVIPGHSSSIRNGLTFGIGRCLNMIHENLETKVNTLSSSSGSTTKASRCDDVGGGSTKMALYSCHDSTVAPILLAMGCYDNKWPPYAADICIELYEKSGECSKENQHWVRVLYCGKEMTLRGCEGPLIRLDQFISVISPYMMNGKQYVLECHNKNYTSIKTLKLYEQGKGEHHTELPPNI